MNTALVGHAAPPAPRAPVVHVAPVPAAPTAADRARPPATAADGAPAHAAAARPFADLLRRQRAETQEAAPLPAEPEGAIGPDQPGEASDENVEATAEKPLSPARMKARSVAPARSPAPMDPSLRPGNTVAGTKAREESAVETANNRAVRPAEPTPLAQLPMPEEPAPRHRGGAANAAANSDVAPAVDLVPKEIVGSSETALAGPASDPSPTHAIPVAASPFPPAALGEALPSGTATPATSMLPTPVDSPGFASALGVHVSLLARGGVQEAELHLNPADLGPVSIRIQLEGTEAQVQFGADLAQTRHAIEAGLPELASALRDAGFTLAGGGVSQHAGQRGRDDARAPLPGDPSARGADVEADSTQIARSLRRFAEGGLDVYA